MVVQLRAHFDGQVFVPDEPVDLPVNQSATIHIDISPQDDSDPVAEKLRLLDEIAAEAVNVGLPDEALSRESIYGDRD